MKKKKQNKYYKRDSNFEQAAQIEYGEIPFRKQNKRVWREVETNAKKRGNALRNSVDEEAPQV